METNEFMGEQELEIIAERISKLRGGLVIAHPGGSTDIEIQESRDRLEDAICAVKAAIEEGFVPGGGLALIRASVILEQLKSTNVNQDW